MLTVQMDNLHKLQRNALQLRPMSVERGSTHLLRTYVRKQKAKASAYNIYHA